MPLLHAIPLIQSSSPLSHASNTRSDIHKHHRSPKPRVLASSHHLLDQIPQTDTFAWNTLIQTHLADGEPELAILVYRQMLVRGGRPDKHTLPRVLTAASLADAFSGGRQIHGHVVKNGFASERYVVTALMAMYGRFNGADAARKVLDGAAERNSVAWTQLAKLYMDEGRPDLALQAFKQMVDSCVPVDSVTLATALKACGQLKSIHEGRKVHEISKRNGLEFDLLVSNSILKMYIECRMLDEAHCFFEWLPSKDVVSWTTIIGGYVQSGEFNEGFKLFREMSLGGMKPDSFSVTSLLPACARMSAAKHGREIHGYVIRHRLDSNPTVQNALMDMYIKSGRLEPASGIFYQLEEKDVVSWTIMILGHSLHGQGKLAVELFRLMEKQPASVQLDQTTYSAVLHACCTARMVEEGRFYFNCIRKPQTENFALMAGLLARAGLFDEARAFIEDHRVGMSVEVQQALLDGCRIHRNMKLGKRVAEQLIELEPLNAENYILLSNVLAASMKWDEAERTKQTIRDMGLRTKKATSWIEVRGKIHVFGVGDVSHPRSEGIYWELQKLRKRMEENGYLPDDNFCLHEVDEERECIPSGHSEMLAIAFGLISIPESTAIRVTKNLRVCQNCHSSTKMISKFVGREIVLKDPNRFHHFKDGLCSCEDYW